eukprot:TRINITY_DN74763_c0_g1_i1.p1 TRINITY_DN74763_c0_g1~~TRINITY_DN74763_c0_g1_i1.p1  ORF type:complete len:674 (+),score=111.89 TRINITY_DN74763_c0_g1_i1:69-2090(+)
MTQSAAPAGAGAAAEARVHEDLVEEFRRTLIERYGSVVKAWRRVLDPKSLGRLFFSELVEALTRVSWHGDAAQLWSDLIRRSGIPGGRGDVGLHELSPSDHAVLQAFHDWVVPEFGGPIEMFQSVVACTSKATVTLQEFKAACAKRGGDTFDPVIIFNETLDMDGVGSASHRDFASMERNALKRETIIHPEFAMDLEAGKASLRQRQARERVQKEAQQATLREFRGNVRAVSGGSFVRGWRRLLDVTGNLAVSKVELLKGCRKIGFHGDPVLLWKTMDINDEGVVLLLHADVRMATVLAVFKKWAHETYGCSVAALEQLAAVARRRSPRWNVEDFVAALSAANFPGVLGVTRKQAVHMLHEAFDMAGSGSITSEDVAFLDRWEPTAWLSATPDFKEKERFKEILLIKFSSYVVAWRRLLDHNDTNRVSYKSFCDACRSLHPPNLPGLWRALDTNASGFISLRDVDRDAADVLLDFKEWAQVGFGSLANGFRALDTSRSGSMSFPFFSRALQNFGYTKDARLLFQSLKADFSSKQHGRDPRLTLADLSFLASWEVGATDAPLINDELDDPTVSVGAVAPVSVSASSRSALPPTSPHCAAACPPSAGRRTRDHLFFCRSPWEHQVYRKTQSSSELPKVPRLSGDDHVPQQRSRSSAALRQPLSPVERRPVDRVSP